MRRVFQDSSGKFAVGETSNYIYLDIQYAFRQMINSTLKAKGKNINSSALVTFMNDGSWTLGEMASEATVNVPNRIKVYSNPDYEKTYSDLN